MQKGRVKGPLGNIVLLDKASTCATVLASFSKAERQSPSFAAAIRAKAVLQLWRLQEHKLAEQQLLRPLMTIEMPLARVLSDMECKGICMDRRVYTLSKNPLQRRQAEVVHSTQYTPVASSLHPLTQMKRQQSEMYCQHDIINGK